MPILNKIVVRDFRNIALQELSFSPNINCLSGNNGEGKTNLMDAIFYLAMTKSAVVPADRYNFRYGADSFALSGSYRMENGQTSRISIQVEKDGSKKLVRDDKPCPRLSAHIGLLPTVIVTPSDSALVSESGEDRRRFVNAVLSQMDPEYLAAIQQYNRLLAQRNRLLRDGSGDDALLDVLDARMEAVGKTVHEARAALARDLAPAVAAHYKTLSGGSEQVDLAYRSDCTETPLSQLLAASREKDRVLRYTTAGLQRDDLVFTMDGHPIRRCGSQGQQKSFLVALKFAQYDIMKRRYGFAPTLLLDDVFDKLDFSRISNLIGMVSGQDFGQIFLTDTDRDRIGKAVARFTDECAFYEASGGSFKKV